MKDLDYGQLLSALGTYEAFLLSLWGFFYTGHAALIIALYYRNRRLSTIETGVLLAVYVFGWSVNYGGIRDAYIHMQEIYKLIALEEIKGLPTTLIDYYKKPFWGPGGDRHIIVPLIYWIALALTVLFILGCHIATWENWLKKNGLGQRILKRFLPSQIPLGELPKK